MNILLATTILHIYNDYSTLALIDWVEPQNPQLAFHPNFQLICADFDCVCMLFLVVWCVLVIWCFAFLLVASCLLVEGFFSCFFGVAVLFIISRSRIQELRFCKALCET